MERWSRFYVAVLVLAICSARQVHAAAVGEAGSKENVLCDTCLDLSNEAQMILSDPDTAQQAIELLTQTVCQPLLPSFQKKCTELVLEYVPDALMMLQLYVGPEICTMAGLCLPGPPFSSYQARGKKFDLAVPYQARGKMFDLAVPVADTKACGVCEGIAEHALTYLGSDMGKVEVILALHLACSKTHLRKLCNVIVNRYAPEMIEHLEDMTPRELCEATRFCKPTREVSVALPGGPNECTICQFVVLEVKLKLEDPVTQDKLVEVLLSGCNRVQNHVDECKVIVAEYTPFLLANLDTLLDAGTLCSKMGVCQAPKVEAFEPLLALPSEGRTRHVHTF